MTQWRWHELPQCMETKCFFLQEVYTNGLRGLVQLTSASIELFRKMAEVSLLPQVCIFTHAS